MKQDTQQLIDALVEGNVTITPIPSPVRLTMSLALVLLGYMIAMGLFMGLRPDLMLQLHRPFFFAEVLLLVLIAVSSLMGAVHFAFPDQYQHAGATRLPIIGFIVFVLLLGVQGFLPFDPRMVIPVPEESHAMECTLCVALVAMLPSMLLFIVLRKGASTSVFASGAYVVLAAASIGCLMLRLSEANDSLLHLAVWHYIPTLLFAAAGALMGRIFLKW